MQKGAATSFKQNRIYLTLRIWHIKLQLLPGSGRGIGKETAILLSKMGLNVVICSRTQNEIDSTVDQIKEIIKRTNHGGGVEPRAEYLV